MNTQHTYYVFSTPDKQCVVNFIKNMVEAPKSYKVNFYCGKNLLLVCHGLTYSESNHSYQPVMQIRREDDSNNCEIVVDPRYLLCDDMSTVREYVQDALLVSGVDELTDRGFTPVCAYTNGYIVSFDPSYAGPLAKFKSQELLDAACDYLNLDKNQILTDSEVLSNIQKHFNEVSMYIDKAAAETFMYSLIPDARKLLSIVGRVDSSSMLYKFVIHSLLKHLTGKNK